MRGCQHMFVEALPTKLPTAVPGVPCSHQDALPAEWQV